MADRMWADAYRLGSRLARTLPGPMAQRLPDVLGVALATSMPSKRRMIERHLGRIHGPSLTGRDLKRASAKAFESYARYWLESFRLPDKSVAELRAGIDVPNYHHVQAGLDAGRGVILALPHLGGWEWAGFWMAAAKEVPITVVVEAIEPPELFEWFTSFRESLGMHVVPLGPDSATAVISALKRNEVVCLLSDRDIGGGGIEVDFFDERTTLPGGPALLGLRSGAPVLPTGVYFTAGGGHVGVVQPPLDTTRHGKLRQDVNRVTQELAGALEGLIRREPEQWHLFQPNWPSDEAWLAQG
ncbi:MAG: phosphatidylinositol mannoside acyltransferase [Acidimicrobiales bacterium]|jgi:lauroyl/myristoyl acyltransferase